MAETCAIILAAGESTRMKANKLLLPYKDKLIITTVIDNVVNSGVDHILVVLGAFRDEMSKVVGRLPVKFCFNPLYKQGMITSVQCGFRHLPETSDAALIFLGDQPMIPGHVTRKVIETFEQSEKGIIIPVHKGKRGHPVLIHSKYSGEIDKLDPATGMHALLVRFSNDIQEVDVGSSGILRDIDTEEDYKKEFK